MERIPSAERTTFLRDCLFAWEAAANGVTAKKNSYRQTYWLHWEQYASTTKIDPFLNKYVPPLERNIIVGAFDAQVRKGRYVRGNQIEVSGVSDALAAITKTIDLAGQSSQVYRSENKYQHHLERVV